jgi:hypothetical protein
MRIMVGITGTRARFREGWRKVRIRTLDRDRYLGENRPKSLVPELLVFAVPMRAVGGEIRGRWAPGRRLGDVDDRRARVREILHGSIPVTVELADLELDRIDRRVNLRTPFLQRFGGGLQLVDVAAMKPLSFQEALLPPEVALLEFLLELRGNTLLDLIQKEFGVGIHEPLAFSEAGKVVVVGGCLMIQDWESLIPEC